MLNRKLRPTYLLPREAESSPYGSRLHIYLYQPCSPVSLRITHALLVYFHSPFCTLLKTPRIHNTQQLLPRPYLYLSSEPTIHTLIFKSHFFWNHSQWPTDPYADISPFASPIHLRDHEYNSTIDLEIGALATIVFVNALLSQGLDSCMWRHAFNLCTFSKDKTPC
jgi:hypothetical protein